MTILIEDPHAWLLDILQDAHKDKESTLRIYQTVTRYIVDTRDFVGVLESIQPHTIKFKEPRDLADDCFIGVSVFHKTLENKHKNHGLPHIKFYKHAGKSAFNQIGYPKIAEDWNFWESYVQEFVVL